MQTYRKTKETGQGASGVLPNGQARTNVDAPVIDELSQYETFTDFARHADAFLARSDANAEAVDLAQRSEIADIADSLLKLAGFSSELRMIQTEHVQRTGYVAPYATPAGLHRDYVYFLRDWILPGPVLERAPRIS